MSEFDLEAEEAFEREHPERAAQIQRLIDEEVAKLSFLELVTTPYEILVANVRDAVLESLDD